MPSEPRRACRMGCPNDGRTCPQHGPAARRRQYDGFRGSSSRRGYGRRWQAASKLFLSRHPLCGQRPDGRKPVMSKCFDSGYVTLAVQVDHVVPHRGDQTLFWSEENWQSLCSSCGAAKTRAGQ